ncbi:Hypothetical protein SRAE_0000047100 [Strongyloides ratti]|uniref:Uncharacterized protein n=1 Tax=Strongyloides ratti TaxID=34506 RepID=A0A090KV02_STRRB|nr:Hypothetical protein SRAE_0000047100 [Strongyloides ratti]CEF61345.1 Hypothetical protein SRAE_0000047100 [Strongyloides ratti]
MEVVVAERPAEREEMMRTTTRSTTLELEVSTERRRDTEKEIVVVEGPGERRREQPESMMVVNEVGDQ